MKTKSLYRKYGHKPFSVAAIHGGPGGRGEMQEVARKLSSQCGILEPLQSAYTIDEELLSLKSVLDKEASFPALLIGHSWGAWLSLLFAAKFPSLVRKVLCVGCPPFEEKYAPQIMKTRLNRLNAHEREEFKVLQQTLQDEAITDKNGIFSRLGSFISQVDAFDPIPCHASEIECDYIVYEKIWREARNLRSSGQLIHHVCQIQCPIVVIHGEYDPHPIEGVREPLSKIHHDTQYIVLEKCGHCPWIEKQSRDQFFSLVKKEILT